MKKIYFYNGAPRNKSYSLGLLSSIIHSTYIYGMDNRYDDIILEWPSKLPYPHWISSLGHIQPPQSFLPKMSFVNKGTKLDCESIDISGPNTLFEGCKPLTNKILYNCEYLNYMYNKTKKSPIIEFKKDKYIVFHYRMSPEYKQLIRNTPLDWFETILIDLRIEYPDYKIYKIGEECTLDEEFDEVIPYLPGEIDKLYKLIGKASLFVGSESGPAYISYMFGTPSIILQDKQTEECIKNSNIYDWVNKNHVYRIDVDEPILENIEKRSEYYKEIITGRSS